ncbi:MAG: MBL fold metallo-hydrolase [Myxococcales bacterium]|nr:MBL fold metallo-hydrolase [Myxococcales bacterium]
MFFRQFLEAQSSTWTYLLADRKSGEAVIIDPVLETVERDLRNIRELGLTLLWSLETHVHADHVTGAAVLKDRTGCQTGICHTAALPCVDRGLAHGDRLTFGRYGLTVLETPGHTDCSVSFVSDAPELQGGGAAARRAFTGDALLIRGCGRTDFQRGDAAVLYRAVHAHLFTLPDDTIVHPAHDYNGCTASTIGEERTHNPRLTQDEPAFVALMAALNLPRPQQIDVAVPANRLCGRSP